MTGAQATWLPEGRLHLNHGPIDLIVQAWGDEAAVRRGHDRAIARFSGQLEELVAELPALRAERVAVSGSVARMMAQAIGPFRPAFITPMAAVAGAVAETILSQLVGPGLRRAYVNNGGDIALYLTAGESLPAAIATGPDLPGRVTVRMRDPVRGIATSGWRGRSFSFGIADAAATMIANAVDLPGHPVIIRRPDRDRQADTDLGARLVTVAVGPLTRAEVRVIRARGLIEGAALFLQGGMQTTGEILLTEASPA